MFSLKQKNFSGIIIEDERKEGKIIDMRYYYRCFDIFEPR